MKKVYLLNICIMIAALSHAQQVSYQEARQAAQSFFAKQQKAVTQCAHIETSSNHDTLFYVFNTDNAYVLIAADKRCQPVLAFSDKTTFQTNNIIPPVQMWMDNYAAQIQSLKQQNAPTPHREWLAVLQPQKDFDNDIEAVAPLLTSQ